MAERRKFIEEYINSLREILKALREEQRVIAAPPYLYLGERPEFQFFWRWADFR
jgi:hypothetical protein